MMRTLNLIAVFIALVAITSGTYADEVHKGKVVSVSNGKLTMTDTDGKNEHSQMVPADATITCDGQECKLDDLTKDCWVTVTRVKKGDAMVVTKVEAKKSRSPK